MSDKQRQAQQDRRNREREQAAMSAAEQANAAAEGPDTDPVNSEGDEPPQMPTVDHSARMASLEALRKKPEDMDEYIKSETEDESQTEANNSAASADHGNASSVASQVQTPAQTSPAAPASELQAELVTVKIDGEESQVTKTDVDALGGVAAYQIHKAAEKRLAQANQEKQEMARLLDQARTLIQQNQPKEPVKSPSDLIKEKVAQIQFGTPDEAAAAIQEIMSANTQRIDPNAIVNQAVSQMQQQSAALQFVQANHDILQNPVISRLALVLEHDKLSKSRPADWGKFYSDLQVEIRNALGKPATTQTPSVPTPQDGQPTSDRDAKLSRKDNIVNLPTAAARVATPEEPKPLTRDDRLNLLRKSRGQPVG